MGIGTTFVLVLFSVSGGSGDSPFSAFLRPGAFLASWAGCGAHDIGGFLLYIAGNVAFYVLLCFFILWLVRGRVART